MKNKGITLISMIITIVVLVIIAAVVIRLGLNSDNSVIANAEKSKYKNTIANVEQWINEYYTNHYSELEENENKAEALVNYFESTSDPNDNVFYKWTSSAKVDEYNTYADSRDFSPSNRLMYLEATPYQTTFRSGKIVYLIDNQMLSRVNPNLGLDKEKPIYENLEYVIAVTSDLRVGMLFGGLEDILGFSKDDLVEISQNTVIFEKDSEEAKILNYHDKDVTYQDIKSIKSITINLSEVTVDPDKDVDFSNLNYVELILTGTPNSDWVSDVLESSKNTLKVLKLKNTNIPNFSGLSADYNLEKLFLWDCSQAQFDGVARAIAQGTFAKLKYFGACGDRTWSYYWECGFETFEYQGSPDTDNRAIGDISLMGTWNATTKNAVKYMYLVCNKIESVQALSGFDNLVKLKLNGNLLSSVQGLSSKSSLQVLRLEGNRNLTSIEGLSGLNSLNYLDLRNCLNLSTISPITGLDSLTKLWFISPTSYGAGPADSDKNLSIDDITNTEVNQKLRDLGNGLLIDSKYSKYLLDIENVEKLEIKSSSSDPNTIYNKSEFEMLANSTKLKELSLNGLILKDNNGNDVSDEEYTSIINNTLGQISSLTHIQIINMPKLKNISFMSRLTKVVEFDLRDCPLVTDVTSLNGITTLGKLSLNNPNINLTSIQPALNSVGRNFQSGVWTAGAGLLLAHNNLYSQLENCTELTKLRMNRYWTNQIPNTYGLNLEVDLTRLTKLDTFFIYAIGVKFKLPASVKNVTVSYLGDSAYGIDMSKCTNLVSITVGDGINMPEAQLQRMFDSIPSGCSLQTLSIAYCRFNTGSAAFLGNLASKCNNLKKLSITSNAFRTMHLNSLEGIKEITSLEELTISYLDKYTVLEDISNLSNLKKLSITDSTLKDIPEESNLRNIPNLTTVDFTNDCVASLGAFVIDGGANSSQYFRELTTMNLTNNCIYDDFTVGVMQYFVQESVFVPLYNQSGKFRNLYLAGNQMKNFGLIKNLSWSNKSGF